MTKSMPGAAPTLPVILPSNTPDIWSAYSSPGKACAEAGPVDFHAKVSRVFHREVSHL